MKMSHVDVVQRAMELGLGYDEAESLADFLCPEYRLCAVARFTNKMNRIFS